MPPKKKNTKTEDTIDKPKSLFDHINAIRRDKNPTYFSTLSDVDKKTFNHYMIVRCLSMDRSTIEEMAYISKYFDKIPSELFYKLCCDITPKTFGFFPYIKNKKEKYNKELLSYISKKFNISSNESRKYCEVFRSTSDGTNELIKIIRGFGLTEKEAKKIVDS